ncbi:hypothetical protein MLP_30760 [Microlunatus phosphovorus NM-1]|uniref:Uncharacterized protein n=1 Tax=Microlunatus phosphovorus (strain ATCC 700054 / DSM 10555 / JCM 9379 / NBRC 101784 / NCIMB 13414 / VKM Ac-1990 / NM-1) TaxID=1032480 RepID=F5XKL8_MICPN|nr:hypothetical protein MLP_30760 [Microlunatus phosphovorus NM-1]
MVAGADSIDDPSVLRHGGMPRLFGGIRAPPTIGTLLRSFTHDPPVWESCVPAVLTRASVGMVSVTTAPGTRPSGLRLAAAIHEQ